MSDDPAPGALRSQHDQDDQNDDLSRGVRRGASEGFGTASQLSVVRAFVEEHLAAILVQGDEFGRWWNFAMHNVRNKILQVEQAAVPAAELREQLAALSHDQWAGWMRYLFSRCYFTSDGAAFMEVPDTRRWQRQMNTPYVELSEPEKESDREEADRVLEALKLPSSTNAVNPQDRRVDGSQRAADSSSDPDRGAALGRLPLDLPIATRYFEMCLLESDLDDAVLRAFGADPDELSTWMCSDLVYDEYDSSFELWDCRDGWLPTQAQVDAALDLGFARCWLVWGGTQERYCTRGAIGELKTNSFKRSDDRKWQLTKLTADVARLRHLAHQLEGYAKHAFTCELTRFGTDVQITVRQHVCGLMGYNPMIDPECPGCADSRNHNYRVPHCTCGLAALTEPPA